MERPDIPDVVLAGSWKDAVRQGYKVTWRAFYGARTSRSIVPTAKRSPTPTCAKYGGDWKAMEPVGCTERLHLLELEF